MSFMPALLFFVLPIFRFFNIEKNGAYIYAFLRFLVALLILGFFINLSGLIPQWNFILSPKGLLLISILYTAFTFVKPSAVKMIRTVFCLILILTFYILFFSFIFSDDISILFSSTSNSIDIVWFLLSLLWKIPCSIYLFYLIVGHFYYQLLELFINEDAMRDFKFYDVKEALKKLALFLSKIVVSMLVGMVTISLFIAAVSIIVLSVNLSDEFFKLLHLENYELLAVASFWVQWIFVYKLICYLNRNKFIKRNLSVFRSFLCSL